MKLTVMLCALALGLAGPAAAQEITVETLTDEAGSGYCVDLNDRGQAVGTWNNGAFVWSREAGLVVLGLPHSEAYAINNAGEIVGVRFDGTGWEAFHRSSSGTLTAVSYPGANSTRLMDINDSGVVAGLATFPYGYGPPRGFLWTTEAGFSNLPAGFWPAAINEVGEVAGDYVGFGLAHAAIWSASYGLVDLGVLRRESRGFALNDDGLVAGQADAEDGTLGLGVFAMLASRNRALGLLEYPAIAAHTHAYDVDAEGRVVGDLTTEAPQRGRLESAPALWQPSGELVLLPTLPNSHTAGVALAINNSGQACGWNLDSTGNGLPLLWTFKQTPQQIIAQLQQMVQALKASGSINGGQANALLVKLNAALAALEASDPATAIARLQDFVNQANAFVSAGILTADEAQPMIDLAQQAIAQLQG